MRRKHCLFSHNGTPTTKPGTDDDKLRIALSRWITAMLVHNGDEQPGQYQTPGANGYTPEQLVAAAAAPAPTERELQVQVLAAIRTGSTASKALQDAGLNAFRIHQWRQNPAFLAEYNEALNRGLPKRKHRSLRAEVAAHIHRETQR